MKYLALLLLVGCVTTEGVKQGPSRRERDRQFYVWCLKELYNQGISEQAAIQACEKALDQPN